ncbi:MAG: hypothetical protein R3F62_00920 [Planctomycetota bacterium]
MPDSTTPPCAHCQRTLDAPLRGCAGCGTFLHQSCAETLGQRCASLACRRPLVGGREELARAARFSLGDLALMVGLPVLVGVFFHRALPPSLKGLKVALWTFPWPLGAAWAALRRIPGNLRRVALLSGPRAAGRLWLLVSPLLALALFAKGTVDGEAALGVGVLAGWFALVALALCLFQVAVTADLVRAPRP